MKRTTVAGVLALVSLAACGAAGAQNARIITFQEAIRIALDQNVSVRQAEHTAALGQVAVSEARGQFLPNLTFSTSGSQNFGRNSDSLQNQSTSQNTRSASMGFNSGVTVFDGFGNIAQLRSAQLSGAANEQDLQRARETV